MLNVFNIPTSFSLAVKHVVAVAAGNPFVIMRQDTLKIRRILRGGLN